MGYEYKVKDRVLKDCDRVIRIGGTEYAIHFDEAGRCHTNDSLVVAFLNVEDPDREILRSRRT